MYNMRLQYNRPKTRWNTIDLGIKVDALLGKINQVILIIRRPTIFHVHPGYP